MLKENLVLGTDSTMKPETYFDSALGVDFVPSGKPTLLFKAWLSHGPGSDEDLAFYVGPNAEHSHDVLWLESDYSEGFSAIAWAPREVLPSEELSRILLTTYWQREKEENESEEPNFTEVLKTEGAALSPKQVNEMAKQIWPEF
jgi:hypothetical protein